MKKLIQISAMLALSVSLIACSCNKPESTPATNPGTNNNGGGNNNGGNTQQGTGSITLTCNGTTLTNAGNCNYSSVADCIVVADANKAQNIFTLNLDGGLPAKTTTYTIVDDAVGSEKASMSFVQFPDGKMIDWESGDINATVTLTVEGNKITCSFKDILLEPAIMYNPDELNHQGGCSGSFTLYK